MLSGVPKITGHAALRAFERLGLARAGFEGWVAATWRDWMPINACYLSDRGVKVSAQGRHYFITPWNWRDNVALALSEDFAVVTVIPFAVEPAAPVVVAETQPIPTKREAKRLSQHEVALNRIIKDLGLRLAIAALLRPSGISEEHLNIALAEYANGLRDLAWLKHFVKLKDSGSRDHALQRRGRALTELDKRFITPAEPEASQ